MQRWAFILSMHQCVLEYAPGSQNKCAGCLLNATAHMCSIHTMDLDSLPVMARDIAKATLKDNWLAGVLQRVQHGQWGNAPLSLYDCFYRWLMKLSCQNSCVLWG